ncbi:hypothetical protein [Raineyella fluvialis]|uniref:Uncharacterized protein n=1 Tax=Raineyella fluvialis TaxID=2662261 RepID=A0A5Q2FCT5_9ACTN|nr:hypothetical protein [Raineyella fluvialis]QGF24742.1 hypothetical protein Rai3103_15135 [Raineyella fluvialis]
MSRRRARKAPGNAALDALVGRSFPGGCDDCHAYQTMTRDSSGIYRVTTYHDNSCPYFRGVTR